MWNLLKNCLSNYCSITCDSQSLDEENQVENLSLVVQGEGTYTTIKLLIITVLLLPSIDTLSIPLPALQ